MRNCGIQMATLDLPTFLAVVAFVVGAIVGSFLNVVIYRIPRGVSVNSPRRSFCPSCDYRIPFYHNIPLISWFLLRGKCNECAAAISVRYWCVELLTALLFLATWLRFGDNPQLVPVVWILLGLLISATFIDFDYQIIPDGITKGGAVVGVLAIFIVPSAAYLLMDCVIPTGGGFMPRFSALGWSLAGGVAGYGLLFAVVVLGRLAFGRKALKIPDTGDWSVVEGKENPVLITGSERTPFEDLFFVGSERIEIECGQADINGKTFGKTCISILPDRLQVDGEEIMITDWRTLSGKANAIRYYREAMGFGDVKFMALIGVFLGWKAVLFTVFVASVTGTAVSLPSKILRRDGPLTRIPFGPYLAFGAGVWIFYGQDLIEWYFGLMRGAGG
jgi:leader peptidase (prepilin peptidase)/N-methyltransferase